MASANEKLIDLSIQHALHLLKAGNGIERDILKLLAESERDIVAKLAQRMALIEERSFDLGPKTTERLNAMLGEIRTLNTQVYSKAHDELKRQLTDLADNELEHHAKALSAATGIKAQAKVASPTLLKSIVSERPLEGRLLASWFKGAEAGSADRVEAEIRKGITQGHSIDKMVSAIRGTKAGGYRDGVMEVSRRSAQAIVRTSVSHVNNQAQQETWKQNSDLVKGWTFVATLDSRTTIVCASNDGEVFEIGEGPIPPLHVNCRSTTTAVTRSFDEMGLDRNDYSADQRASLDGQVPKPKNFEAWLKSRDEAFQDEVLGKARADLWRAGKFNLADFVRDRREVIPLSELRGLQPKVAPDLPAPAKPALAQEAAKPNKFSPINPDTTAESIKVVRKSQAVKAIEANVRAGANDPRYDSVPEFRSVKATDFGKAALGTSLTDEAASLIAALAPELDAISDAFNVPRLRGYRMIKGKSSATASMGDGIMNLNGAMFNSFAQKVGTKKINPADLKARADALREELRAIDRELAEVKAKRATLETLEERAAISVEIKRLIEAYNAKVKETNKASKLAFQASYADRPASTWKPGDEPLSKPFVTTDYFSDIDKARSVLYHEMAHQIHQMLNKTVRRNVAKPPLEIELSEIYRKRFYGVSPEHRKAADEQVSRYARENEKEWFAENFAVYMMGREDLCDPEVAKLIKRLLNDNS